MGETREIFSDLLGDLDRMSTERVQHILKEIAAGTACFGRHREWTDWYHYLLARLLYRSNERYLWYTLEVLNTCFFALYPDERNVQGPYRAFKHDALATLGQSIMDRSRWDGDRPRLDQAFHRGSVAARTGYPLWRDVSGDLSSSLFFCTKYLDGAAFEPWLVSILAIDHPHWRAQLMVWFVHAHPILAGEITQISQLDPGSTIAWGTSHLLDGNCTTDYGSIVSVPFLAADTRATKYEMVAWQLRRVDFGAWRDAIARVDFLQPVLDEVSDRFAELYV